MADIEFFIDENLLGLDRYLDFYETKYRKVGDEGCPGKGTADPEIVKFAHKEDLTVLTSDEKLTKHCNAAGIGCISHNLSDFAETVKKYAEGMDSNK